MHSARSLAAAGLILATFAGCSTGPELLLTKISRAGDSSPNGASFGGVGSAETDGTNIVFESRTAKNGSTNSEGLYLSSGAGGIQQIALFDYNDLETEYAGFPGYPMIDNGAVAFVAYHGPGVEYGLFLKNGASTTLLHSTPNDSPFFLLDYTNGKYACQFEEGNNKIVRVFNGTTFQDYVDLTAAGFWDVGYAVFQSDALRNRLVFSPTVDFGTPSNSIYIADGNSVNRILGPDFYVSFTIQGDVIYYSTLLGGIFSYNLLTQSTTTIVSPGSQVPGGGQFSRFGAMSATAQGDILFEGFTNYALPTVYGLVNGKLYRVVGPGDTVDDRQVQLASIGNVVGKRGVVTLHTPVSTDLPGYDSVYSVDLTKNVDGDPLPTQNVKVLTSLSKLKRVSSNWLAWIRRW